MKESKEFLQGEYEHYIKRYKETKNREYIRYAKHIQRKLEEFQ